MSDFNLAIIVVLRHEGGLVDDSVDPGGITHYGISLRYLKELRGDSVTAADIRNLTIEQAKAIYFSQWWQPNHYGEMIDQGIATAVFDLGVNIGAIKANRLLQVACCELMDDANYLAQDGIIGKATLACLNTTLTDPEALLKLFMQQATHYYQQLVVKNPNLDRFLVGWLARVNSYAVMV